MKNIVVVGSQWGDEGKGKIVDWLSEQADIVIRFQGGHNAGHTLVIDGVTYKLRLLPFGIVRKGKISIIGNGVVVDPWALLEEIEEIKSKGVEVNVNNFIISESANLILPFHREMDEIREDYDLLARLHILKKKGFYIPVPLYRYYIHGKNITLKKERKKMELKMKEKYGL